MSLPGYDEWKLMTPDEDREMRGDQLCPFCGAYSPRQCELEEETGGTCPWEESLPDPDEQRDRRRDEHSDKQETF